MDRTITALVQDKPGVLNRITSMFRRRGFNISSLAVGQSEKPNLSRMTFVVQGNNAVVEQLLKNLDKLIDVIKVSAAPNEDVVSRELALIRVSATPDTRKEIVQIADIFRAHIVGVSPDSLIIEVAGDADKMTSMQDLLKGYGLLEVMRTGTIVMHRGKSS
ncbi:acetolactate synthase small subunit [SAR202 cluster bacterium AC-409-J13_OGT_754m]|nr:acetolactate synthase small subunit [SAR202 cluster bacterium AC-409-J13_OGT_754m]